MKALIVYKSKSGFTKRYAEWINERLDGEMIELKQLAKKDLADYDVILFGSRIFAGTIDGWKKAKPYVENAKGRAIVFATGATPGDEVQTIKTMWETNFTPEELKVIPHFYLPAGVDLDKLRGLDKFIMKVVMKSKMKQATPEQLAEMGDQTKFDASDKKYIQSLVACAKQPNE